MDPDLIKTLQMIAQMRARQMGGPQQAPPPWGTPYSPAQMPQPKTQPQTLLDLSKFMQR